MANRPSDRAQGAMLSKVAEQVKRVLGILPISYEVSAGNIVMRNGSSSQVLVRVADILSWTTAGEGGGAVLIRLRDGDKSIAVGDRRGALRDLLQRIALDCKVSG